MNTPGGRVLERNTAEGCFQVLIGPLSLTVCLRMIARRQTHRGSQGLRESLSDSGNELGATVRNNVCGNSMKAEHVGYQEVSSSQGCGELRKSHKMCSLRKPVHNCENGSITLRQWESGNKVQSYV